MTLEEAIYKEEALAYSFGERWKRLGEPVGDLPELEAEHRQMADWLRELKSWREAEIVQMATGNTKTLIFNKEGKENG